MIKIKKGGIQICEIYDIIGFDFDNDEITWDTWYDYPLQEEVCILEIPEDSTKLKLHEVHEENLHFIPRISDSDDEFYDVFWNSNETYVFECYQYAISFMENYEGNFKSEINELFKDKIESELVYETVRQFSNVNELAEEFDVDFMNELEDIVYSKSISMNSILNSMKLFMLDKYRFGIQEEKLSRLN